MSRGEPQDDAALAWLLYLHNDKILSMLKWRDPRAPAMLSNTRATNMERRRQRILAEARTILARDGLAALTVRSLAQQAAVTVPTIYNLVGNKDDLLRQLIEELLTRCEQALEDVEGRGPIDMIQRVVGTLAALFAEDEDFCRAALLAGQRLERSAETAGSLHIWRRSSQIAMRICIDAGASGLLRGDIDPRLIGERAYDSYRIAAIDWVNGDIDAHGFEHRALSGFYLCLAADAVPKFRKALMTQLAAVNEST